MISPLSISFQSIQLRWSQKFRFCISLIFECNFCYQCFFFLLIYFLVFLSLPFRHHLKAIFDVPVKWYVLHNNSPLWRKKPERQDWEKKTRARDHNPKNSRWCIKSWSAKSYRFAICDLAMIHNEKRKHKQKIMITADPNTFYWLFPFICDNWTIFIYFRL